MAVLVKGLGDRNVALKKTYAIALGHLVRVAKESSVVKLMETLENRYLEAEDEDSRLACMHTLQVILLFFSTLTSLSTRVIIIKFRLYIEGHGTIQS